MASIRAELSASFANEESATSARVDLKDWWSVSDRFNSSDGYDTYGSTTFKWQSNYVFSICFNLFNPALALTRPSLKAKDFARLAASSYFCLASSILPSIS